MSGHSKWSTIKRKKGVNDAARGKIFAKISKEIMISVREGGSDSASNTRLKSAIIKGHSENMPNANIERAIKKASGDSGDTVYEELSYEGYAQGGIAVLVQCLTDNKNRTGPEVRHVFTKYGGNLGENGCVSYLFSRKGIIMIDISYSEDEVFETTIEAGASDMQVNEDNYEIQTTPENFVVVIDTLKAKEYEILHAEIVLVPEVYIAQDEGITSAVLTLIEHMEDLDDVQSVSHNLALNDD